MPGGVSDARPLDEEAHNVWKDAVSRIDSGHPNHAKLVGLGRPTEVKTQVVAGTKYIFGFRGGSTVSVWSQPWTDKCEITSMELAEVPTLGGNGGYGGYGGGPGPRAYAGRDLFVESKGGVVNSRTGEYIPDGPGGRAARLGFPRRVPRGKRLVEAGAVTAGMTIMLRGKPCRVVSARPCAGTIHVEGRTIAGNKRMVDMFRPHSTLETVPPK